MEGKWTVAVDSKKSLVSPFVKLELAMVHTSQYGFYLFIILFTDLPEGGYKYNRTLSPLQDTYTLNPNP